MFALARLSAVKIICAPRKFPVRSLFSQLPNRCKGILETNTNVAKDIILFKYDNPRHFIMLNLFGVTQLGFWTYLSYFVYNNLRDAPIKKEEDETLPWWKKINLGEQKYKNTLSAVCIILGYLMFFSAWSYTIRSVRFLILNKGGKNISLVTYTPLGKNKILTVPLKYVSAVESRHNTKVQLPIKVKGQRLYYMLDMKGEFKQPELFDATAGLKRKL